MPSSTKLLRPAGCSRWQWVLGCLSVTVLSGCYVPLHSPGIPARELPYHFRMPNRSIAPTLNLARLTVPPPADYILGPNDTVEVTIPGLHDAPEVRPISARIMADETITLPLVGKVKIGGMNLSEAQTAINAAYADGFLVNPLVSVALGEKHSIDVSIMGQVTSPGVYALPRYENDVGHALAMAGGMLEIAAEKVEVHRRVTRAEFEELYVPMGEYCPNMIIEQPVPVEAAPAPDGSEAMIPGSEKTNKSADTVRIDSPHLTSAVVTADSVSGRLIDDESIHRQFENSLAEPPMIYQKSEPVRLMSMVEIEAVDVAEVPSVPAQPVVPPGPDGDDQMEVVLEIPLRGGQIALRWDGGEFPLPELSPKDVSLESGDVVLIPRQQDEVFFVTGPLSLTGNRVNFSVQNRDRQLGNAFLIPPDRDVDVVTAVAMAGYIDPIDSPSTVTVHRTVQGGSPMLITVDLIAARFDWNENLYVQPGDIIYLNPDCAWWSRRTFDRIVPILLTAPYNQAMRRWIAPFF